MKNFILIFCFLITGKMAAAQSNTFPSSGNAGIGTTTPTANLEVINSATLGSVHIGSNGNSGYQAQISFMDTDNTTTGDGLGGRRVGIIELQRVSGSTGQDGANMVLYTHEANGTLKVPLSLLHTGNSVFGGNVGIGTSSLDTYKLSVNGHIRAKEIKVETGWADFVFKPDYKLRSLADTERFITKNGHLPGIPSAKEVEKDGINVGEMNAKLLQKIEELTLYLIEKDKEVKDLRERMKVLEAK